MNISNYKFVIRKEKLESLAEVRLIRDPHSDPYYLVLEHVSDWDEILQNFKLYHDEGPLLMSRKMIVLLYSSLSLLC